MAVRESDVCSPIRSVLSWTNLLPFPLLDVEALFATSAGLSLRLCGSPPPQQDPQIASSVFTSRGAVEAIEGVAEHMTVLIVPIDPRSRAVQMLPRRAGKTCLDHLPALRMEEILVFDQQVGEFSRTDDHPHRLKQVQDFGFAHPTLVVQRQDEGSNLGSKLAAVARW